MSKLSDFCIKWKPTMSTVFCKCQIPQNTPKLINLDQFKNGAIFGCPICRTFVSPMRSTWWWRWWALPAGRASIGLNDVFQYTRKLPYGEFCFCLCMSSTSTASQWSPSIGMSCSCLRPSASSMPSGLLQFAKRWKGSMKDEHAVSCWQRATHEILLFFSR